jgi:TetR/AcrR family transcriptional regulator
MIMLCLHRHSLGACTTFDPPILPQHFIRQHVSLVLHGLLQPSPQPEPKQN